MVAGDLIRWDNQRWLIRKIDTNTNTAIIESSNQEIRALGTETPCEVICHPALDWPSVTLPPRTGKVTGVSMGGKALEFLQDWVKMDLFQMGGAIFFNPELRLGYGYRLVIGRNIDRKLFPVDIPRDFVSARVKQARAPKVAAKTTANLYDHLMEDE